MNFEAAYERLAGYGFARRLVQGKVVANVAREGLGQGSLLLAQTAESVVGLCEEEGALDRRGRRDLPPGTKPLLPARRPATPGAP